MKKFDWKEFEAQTGVKKKGIIKETTIFVVSAIVAVLSALTSPVKMVIPNEYWDVKPLVWVFVIAAVGAVIYGMRTILDLSEICIFLRKNKK